MKLLRKFIVIFAALFVFVGTLVIENVFAGARVTQGQSGVSLVMADDASAILYHNQDKISLQAKEQRMLEAGDMVETIDKGGLTLRFGETGHEGLVRLAPYSKVLITLVDQPSGGVFFELKSGRVWLNSVATLTPVNLMIGNVLVIPHQSVVDSNNLNDKVDIFAYQSHVEIGLLSANFTPAKIFNFLDNSFINGFLLVQGNRTQIYFDKIKNNQQVLQKLLVSKLMKEFPVTVLSDSLFDDWLKGNIRDDRDELTVQANAILQNLRTQNVSTVDLNALSYQLGQVFVGSLDSLVLVRPNLLNRVAERRFQLMHDAEYLYLFSRNSEADDHLQAFLKLIDDDIARYGDDYRAVFLTKVVNEYQSLLVFDVDHPLALVRKNFEHMILKYAGHSDLEIQQKFLVLRSSLSSAYAMMDKNTQLAFQSLEDYYQNFNDLVKTDGSRFVRVKSQLAEDNLVWNDLLLRYPQMYHDRFFLMKETVEQTWLNLLAPGADKNEEQQYFISAKIDYLRQLKAFFLDGKIAQIDDAKKIVARLFREIDDLQPASNGPQGQIAVNDLFAQRLQDYGPFFRYLNTPEYVATTLHGAARSDQFNAFVQALQEQVTIDDLRNEILGTQTTPAVTVGQILDLIQTDLQKNGITSLRLGTLSDSTQRFISIQSGVLEGVNFQAQYNWDQHLLEDVVVNGAIISKDAVKLENLSVLLKAKAALDQAQQQAQDVISPTPTDVVNDQPTVATLPSRAEKVAKILLIQKFKSIGVLIGEANIEILDLSQNYFALHNAVLADDHAKGFDFKYFGKQGILTGLIVHAAKQDLPSSMKTLALNELVAEVKNLFQ